MRPCATMFAGEPVPAKPQPPASTAVAPEAVARDRSRNQILEPPRCANARIIEHWKPVLIR